MADMTQAMARSLLPAYHPDALDANPRLFTDIGILRTDLSALHDDWLAGRVGDDVVREALPFCWLRYGSSLEAPETLAMLRAVGPLSDYPERPMPKRFRVYQGRPLGEPLGIGWTPMWEYASAAATVWQSARRARGVQRPAVLWTGTVRAADVLMAARNDVVIAPENVERVHRTSDELAAEDGFRLDSWRFSEAREQRALEDRAAGWARWKLRRDYPWMPDAELAAAVSRAVAQVCSGRP